MENTHPTFNLNGVSTFPSHVEKGKGAHDSATKTAEYALEGFNLKMMPTFCKGID